MDIPNSSPESRHAVVQVKKIEEDGSRWLSRDNQSLYRNSLRPAPLLPSFHGLFAHFNQASLSSAVRKVVDGFNGLVGIFSGQSTGLLNTVALTDKFTSLRPNISFNTRYLQNENKGYSPCAHLPLR